MDNVACYNQYRNRTNRYRVDKNDIVRVAFYGRVSTQHEQQCNSMENQILWYDVLLKEHPNWKKIKVYTDRGISGTNAMKRPGFMQMIQDAKKGEFDLIVTRETSRFARNTVDSLSYTRKLASMGVEILFFNDSLWSFDVDSELRLSIMSALSQEESHKISDRVKAGQKISRQEQVLYGNGNILGYRLIRGLKSKDNTYEIVQEEADTVKRIFELYLEGHGAKKIANILMQEHRLTATGLNHWSACGVLRVVNNRTYTGFKCYNKSYTKSFLDHNRAVVRNKKEHIYVKADFPAIIDEETYYRAQELKSKRLVVDGDTIKGKIPQKDKWTKRLRCECGYTFKKFKWRQNKGGTVYYGYTCYNQVTNRKKSYYIEQGLPTEGRCDVASICDWKLELYLQSILKRLWTQPNDSINLLVDKVSENYEVAKVESDINTEKLLREKERIRNRLDNLVDMRLDNHIDLETYNLKSSQLNMRLEEIESKVGNIEQKPELTEVTRNVSDEINVIRKYLEDTCELDGKEVKEELVDAVVERIIPTEKGAMKWYLKSVSNKIDFDFYEDKYIKIDEFTITFEEAKNYRKSHGNYLRQSQWRDQKIEVYIEIE